MATFEKEAVVSVNLHGNISVYLFKTLFLTRALHCKMQLMERGMLRLIKFYCHAYSLFTLHNTYGTWNVHSYSLAFKSWMYIHTW